MTFLKRFKLPVVTGIFLIAILFSCTEELTTIGATVIGGKPFNTDNAIYDVFAYNKKIQAVRTNKLPLYQLGTFNDPIYGKTEARITSQLLLGSSNPVFGLFSQDTEDNPNPDSENQIPENERIDSVYLYIPYMTKAQLVRDSDGDGLDDEFDEFPDDPNGDTDGDGLSDNQEQANGSDPLNPDTDGDGINDDTDIDFVQNAFPQSIDIDSIYGNRDLPFNFKVERSTFFLRDLDPNTNFEEAQQYFSDHQFSPSFVSDLLFEGEVAISSKQFLLKKLDDPDTSDTDESEQYDRLNPGIRVKLDSTFFKTNFIDKEGSSELLSQANFSEFIRGIHMSVAPTSEDIMLLLDLRNANITVHYSYDRFNTADDTVEERNSTYTLSLLRGSQTGLISGNAVNTLNNDPYPMMIADQMDTGLENDASRIYLKGGSGSYAEINLFDRNNGEEIINQIKANNWIINEANLVFHVDRTALNAAGGIIEPPRVYLYNAETGRIIFDPTKDFSESQTLLGRYLNFNGILEEEADKALYKMRITDHINNMVVRDSTNATLGLVLTSDISFVGVANAMLNDSQEENNDIPVVNTLTPLGTILFGSNVEPANIANKLQLEIFYTETN